MPKSETDPSIAPSRGRGAPTRAQVSTSTVGRLREPVRGKPDLWLVDVDGRRVVVKDYAAAPLVHRLIGRLTIRREARAYRALGTAAGVPVFLGRVDADALALELVNAEQLAFAPRRFAEGPELLAQLQEIITRFEAVGLVDMDLNGRRNLMVDADGRLYVVDLGGSTVLPPGTLRHRLFFGLLRTAHRGAYLKWKQLLTPAELSDDDQEQIRRLGRWRRRWVFSPAGTAWKKGRRPSGTDDRAGNGV